MEEENSSTSSSIANLASTYWNQGRWEEELLTDQHSPDIVYNDYGGAASSFLEAIYGRSASLGNCDSIFRVGANAGSNLTTLCTNDLEGPLVTNRAYTIHVANVSHVTLRNP